MDVIPGSNGFRELVQEAKFEPTAFRKLEEVDGQIRERGIQSTDRGTGVVEEIHTRLFTGDPSALDEIVAAYQRTEHDNVEEWVRRQGPHRPSSTNVHLQKMNAAAALHLVEGGRGTLVSSGLLAVVVLLANQMNGGETSIATESGKIAISTEIAKGVIGQEHTFDLRVGDILVVARPGARIKHADSSPQSERGSAGTFVVTILFKYGTD